jgi:hypothetical protein
VWAVLSLPHASTATRVTHCGNNRLVDRANHPWDQGVGDACGVSATVAACSSVTKHTPLGRSRGRHWCSNADWLNLCVGAGWPGVSPLTAINSRPFRMCCSDPIRWDDRRSADPLRDARVDRLHAIFTVRRSGLSSTLSCAHHDRISLQTDGTAMSPRVCTCMTVPMHASACDCLRCGPGAFR